MSGKDDLHSPCLVAAWPGMGMVGVSATYYLMSKLGMHLLDIFPAGEFFERDSIEVHEGLIRAGRLPSNRIFLWKDPERRRDLIVFIGEAQPPTKGDAFCRRLIDYVKRFGVEQVYTFAAMGTQMRPTDRSRVFGAAIERQTLAEFESCGFETLMEGKISGMNGVLVGIAAEEGMRGGCLLGEMPQMFPQLPFPKAALAVLNGFEQLFGLSLDFSDLERESEEMVRKMEGILEQIEGKIQKTRRLFAGEFQPREEAEVEEKAKLSVADRMKIERLFDAAEQDRTTAYRLKKFLDQLDIFSEYEDRFLDLFKGSD